MLLVRWAILLVASVSSFAFPGQAFGQEAKKSDPTTTEFFERTIRPILVEKCLSCHGTEKAKSDLRLDTREGILKGGSGGAVVVSEKPKESRLVAGPSPRH